MSPELNKSQLIQNFQLHQTVDYHKDSMRRVAHLKSYPLRKASVLIGFVERDNGLNVIFTRRAKHLKHHPGQISFPGGKYEDDDINLAHTALRETYEEIGIENQQISIFGQMPELVTISKFSVTPFLGFVDNSYVTTIDRNEVDEVFEVPARIVFDRYQLHSHQFQFGEYTHRVFGLSYQNHFIWGMTAQIIQALQKHILYR
ncbi:CoA pyrophosphatase [Vibrio japonicus]|uniref:CoA pyrophosphatase n=1 Tax=Vibrio japonicus TaxID=1824638 RepID=A0ABY5LL50_9VIBR|nr:CoA pyrophosphatase [Vibrio japonicus]UUM31626.1 CoA pyrophosphatase [Vibrio japonicus]